MTTLHAPAPKTVMLHPSHDGRVYMPAEPDEHEVYNAARLVVERVLACASASSQQTVLEAQKLEQQRADEAAALVAGWTALAHAQR